MHLVYFDDGGKDTTKILGGVLVDHLQFTDIETNHGLIVFKLFAEDHSNWGPAESPEFHASDLYLGTGHFAGIEESRRHQALIELLSLPKKVGLPYVYSAVDVQALKTSPIRSANWADIAFQMCALTVNGLMEKYRDRLTHEAIAKHGVAGWDTMSDHPLCLLIVDECEKETKARIMSSFRLLRRPMRQGLRGWTLNRLFYAVDDLFFGDSRYSVGLQIADACNYVMWRHLTDGIELKFVNCLLGPDGPEVVVAKPEPEWSQYRHILRSHEDVSRDASPASSPSEPGVGPQ